MAATGRGGGSPVACVGVPGEARLVITTRQRRFIVLATLVVAVAAVAVAMMVWPLESTSIAYIPNGAASFHIREHRPLGLTRWLVLDRRTVGRDGATDLRLHVNAIGLMKGVLVVGLSGLTAWWIGRLTLERLARCRRCDRCNYDLHMLTATRCPECGADVAATLRRSSGPEEVAVGDGR